MKLLLQQTLQALNTIRCEFKDYVINTYSSPEIQSNSITQTDKIIRYLIIAEYCRLQFDMQFNFEDINAEYISYKDILLHRDSFRGFIFSND